MILFEPSTGITPPQDRHLVTLGAAYCPRDRFRTTWQPGKIIRHLVQRGADVCFQALATRADFGHTSVFVQEKELAKQLNCTERSIRTYIRSLEAAGLITTRRRWRSDVNWPKPKLVNQYHFHDHKALRDYFRDDHVKAIPAPPLPVADVQKSAIVPKPANIVPAAAIPQTQTAEIGVIPHNMAMLCWYSRELGTMMHLFYPVETAAAVPAKTQAPRKPVKPKTAGPANPIPTDSPYYVAVRKIANTKYFRSKDPAAYEDVVQEFERLQTPPALAEEIATYIAGSPGYEFRMIAELFYKANKASPVIEEPEPDETIYDCAICKDVGVDKRDGDQHSFCQCARGQAKFEAGWLPEYDNFYPHYWRGIFKNTKLRPDRKPPEREAGPQYINEKAGGHL